MYSNCCNLSFQTDSCDLLSTVISPFLVPFTLKTEQLIYFYLLCSLSSWYSELKVSCNSCSTGECLHMQWDWGVAVDLMICSGAIAWDLRQVFTYQCAAVPWLTTHSSKSMLYNSSWQMSALMQKMCPRWVGWEAAVRVLVHNTLMLSCSECQSVWLHTSRSARLSGSWRGLQDFFLHFSPSGNCEKYPCLFNAIFNSQKKSRWVESLRHTISGLVERTSYTAPTVR